MAEEQNDYTLAGLAAEANLTDLKKLLDIAAKYAITKEREASERESTRYNFDSSEYFAFETTDCLWFDEQDNEVVISAQVYYEAVGEGLGWHYDPGGWEFDSHRINSYLALFCESLSKHMESIAANVSEAEAAAMIGDYKFVAAIDTDKAAEEIGNLVKQKHEQKLATQRAEEEKATRNVATLRKAAKSILERGKGNVALLQRGASANAAERALASKGTGTEAAK